MEDAINVQINNEMWSSNLYLAMSAYCTHLGLNGFARWMDVQASEEMEHAKDMMNYLQSRGGRVMIKPVAAVDSDFGKPLDIAETFYKQECEVSAMIEGLIRLAREEKDMATENFFWKYITEQVEEESNAMGLVDDFRLAEDNKGAILFLDRELGGRVEE
ncbi:MAG: ferritin [Bacteroidia bacterium]|nr:MAG: ferritin [Bacteroidia bacterium]